MPFVEHSWINPNTIEKRDYQEAIVKTSLTGNTLCVIPTGLGKTSIAAMVTAMLMEKDSNKKVLFMAPTKPLANQHKISFERFLKIGTDELKVITGEISPEDRIKLYSKADVIFSTPQTIENDIKNHVLDLKDFCLCIFDEAHRCVGDYAYTFISRAYMNQCSDPLILALTASPGSAMQKINDVKNNLFIKNVEIRKREDDDVKKYVQEVEKTWVEVELPQPFISIKKYLETIKFDRIKKLMNWKIINRYTISKTEILRLQQELARKKTGLAYGAMSVLAEVLKVDHALIMLETQSLYSLQKYFDKMHTDTAKSVERLMKDENFKSAMRLTEELIKEGKEHPKLDKLKEIIKEQLEEDKFSRIIVFSQFRDTITKIHEMTKDIKNSAPIEFIGQAKKKGKGMSQKEQIQTLNEFKMGFYNVLIASQIGEEGLDIEETNLVIFYEPVPSAIRSIQRSGRTARTQSGKVIVLVTKDTRDDTYRWVAHKKEKTMFSVLEKMKNTNLNNF